MLPLEVIGKRSFCLRSTTWVSGWHNGTEQEAVSEGELSICRVAQQHHQSGEAVHAGPGNKDKQTEGNTVRSSGSASQSRPISHPSNRSRASPRVVWVMGPDATSRWVDPFPGSGCLAQVDTEGCDCVERHLYLPRMGVCAPSFNPPPAWCTHTHNRHPCYLSIYPSPPLFMTPLQSSRQNRAA